MKKRQLKKIASRMSRQTPARFRYNERVKAAWVMRMAARSPSLPALRSRPFYWDINARGEVAPCDLWRWAFMFEFQHKWRVLRQTELLPGRVMVSTVFLGTDSSWGAGRPIVFESMIFGGPLDQEQDRYSTREEALAGHEELVARSRAALDALLLPEVRAATPENPIRREDFPDLTNFLEP